jgi:hypothetical protein
MDRLSPESKEATKVIAKACTVVDRRKAVQIAPANEQRRAKGRFEVSCNELAEAVEHYRKAEKAGK